MMMINHFYLFIKVTLFLLLGASWGLAAPGITYQGRLLTSTGAPLVSSAVQFRIQIRTPDSSNCLMYEEIQIKDLSSTRGFFALTINDGSAAVLNTEPYPLDRIFQNRGHIDFDPAKCLATNEVTFNALTGRQLVVAFRTAGMADWEQLPPQELNFVPTALESVTVGGFRGSQLFRVVNGAGSPMPVDPFSEAEYLKLRGVLDGTQGIDGNSAGFTGSLAGDVIGTQGSTLVSRIQGNNVSGTAPLSGQVLTWNAGSSRWEPSNLPAAGNPDWADITGKPATFAPGGAAGGDLSGSYPNPTIAANAVSGGKIADGGVAFSKMAAGSASGQVLFFNGTSWSASKLHFNDLVNASGVSPWPGACGSGQYVTWVSAVDGFLCVNLPATDWADITNKPSTVAVDTIASGAGLYLTYQPDGTACTAGQVLKWNNSRWECGADNDSATGVTSVGVSVPPYMTSIGGPITASGTISLGFDSQGPNRVFAGPSSGSGAPSFRSLSIFDIRADSAGNPEFWAISGPCAAGEMPTYSSALDQVSCQPYSITSSQVTSALGYTPLQSSDLSGYVPTSRTVSAGTGLSGGGDLSANRTLSIAAGGVGSTELASNAVTTAKIADGQVTDAKITGVAVSKIASGAGLYLTYQPDGSACTPGQVLKWNNSRWECGADNDSATAESDPTVQAFAKQAPNSSDFSVAGNELTLNTVPISKGGTGATTASQALNNLLPAQGTHGGKVLRTNGTSVEWVSPLDGSDYVAKAGDSMTGPLEIVETRSETVSPSAISLRVDQSVTPSAASSTYFWAGTFRSRTTGGFPTNTVVGSRSEAVHDGSAGTAATSNMIGAQGLVENDGAATLPTSSGVIGIARNKGTGIMTNAYGVLAYPQNSGSGTIQHGMGGRFLVQQNGAGQVVNGYGVYIDTITATNKWGLYQLDATARNYFAGNVGVGVAVPTEKLDVDGRVKATEFCLDGECLSAWPSAGGGGSVTGIVGTAQQIAVDLTDPAEPVLSLADLTVSPAGVYGSSPQVPVVTVDSKGRVTAASSRFFGIGDLRNSSGTAQIPGACASSQTLVWSAVTDVFNCTNISITTSQISNFPSLGTAAAKNFGTAAGNLVELDGTGRIPASLLPAGGGDVFEQGGNSFGATANLGTNDAHPLSLRTSGSTRLTVTTAGDVGIGSATPRARLDVAGGSVVGQPAISNAGTTINFATGNLQYTSANCGNFVLNNLKDGGSYTLVVQGATSATCSFTAWANTGSGTITVRLPPDHGPTVANRHTMYNIMVLGTHAYFNWVPNY